MLENFLTGAAWGLASVAVGHLIGYGLALFLTRKKGLPKPAFLLRKDAMFALWYMVAMGVLWMLVYTAGLGAIWVFTG